MYGEELFAESTRGNTMATAVNNEIDSVTLVLTPEEARLVQALVAPVVSDAFEDDMMATRIYAALSGAGFNWSQTYHPVRTTQVRRRG